MRNGNGVGYLCRTKRGRSYWEVRDVETTFGNEYEFVSVVQSFGSTCACRRHVDVYTANGLPRCPSSSTSSAASSAEAPPALPLFPRRRMDAEGSAVRGTHAAGMSTKQIANAPSSASVWRLGMAWTERAGVRGVRNGSWLRLRRRPS